MKNCVFYIVVVSLIMFFSLETKAQNVVGLDHLLRKSKLDSLILPCDELNSKQFNIKFPDSIYNQSQITVTKLNLAGIKRVKFQLYSQNHKVYRVEYTIKGSKKYKEFEDLLLKSLDLDFQRLEKTTILKLDDCDIRVEKTKVRKKYFIQFELE